MSDNKRRMSKLKKGKIKILELFLGFFALEK